MSFTLVAPTSRSPVAAIFSRWSHGPSWSLNCVASSSTTLTLSHQPVSSSKLFGTSQANTLDVEYDTASPWYLSLTPLLDTITDLFPPILLAVPKHKVTHSRKSMRSANKGLKNKTNFSHCEACGMIKLAHNICPNCYSQITRRWKREARGEDSIGTASARMKETQAEV